jgi:hypothetical protein
MLGRFCAAIAGLRLALDRQRRSRDRAQRARRIKNQCDFREFSRGWACNCKLAKPSDTATPVSTVTVMVARLWTAAAVVVTLSQHWLDAAALDNGLARTPALGKHSA